MSVLDNLLEHLDSLDCADILRHLVRFDTTNPPGKENECVEWIATVLRAAGIKVSVLADESSRPNLVARFDGRDRSLPPLLLYGHVDVVTTEGQDWSHDPFGGDIIDGVMWGRGTLDMKGGVAMMLSALLRSQTGEFELCRDVVLLILSDEEAGGDHGAAFLAALHPEVFKGIRHAIGEFGAFSLPIGGTTFYPIQVQEKTACWTRVTTTGPSGHSAFQQRDSAVAKLGVIQQRLNHWNPPLVVTEVTRRFFQGIAGRVSDDLKPVFLGLLSDATIDESLEHLGPYGPLFEAMVRNTLNVTMLRGSEQINVLAPTACLEFDARLIPGQSKEDFMKFLRGALEQDMAYLNSEEYPLTIEILRFDPAPLTVDWELFDGLAEALIRHDANGVPIPMLLPASTDARHFAEGPPTGPGIQTYGYLPMRLPSEVNFLSLIHGADERIPLESLRFGAAVIADYLSAR